jgi:hypothetical protein
MPWKEVSEARYDEMLGILPPAMWVGKGFLVGEPHDFVGPMSAALASARCCRTAVERARILAVGFTPRLPPSFFPRSLAAASAALVRALIIPASSFATATICCRRKRPVAPSICGRSANRTSTPASSSRDKNATERVNRSTLLTIIPTFGATVIRDS